MRSTTFCWIIGALASLPGCHLTEKPTGAIVEGSVVDKYTRKPFVGVPIIVRRFRYGSNGGTTTDSITGMRSDANGHYSLAFDASEKGAYYRVITNLYKTNFYDLTAYTNIDGFEVHPNSSQTIDFQVVPLIPTKVSVNLNKQGRQLLSVYFLVDERDGQGYFSPVPIVADTTRTMQQVVAQRLVYLVPNRAYNLTVYRATNHCQSIYNCQAVNVLYEIFRRPIGYPDTAVVQVP